MDTALLLLGLIERTVALAPEIASLVGRFLSGDVVTPEEIERTEELISSSVLRWNKAGEEPKKE